MRRVCEGSGSDGLGDGGGGICTVGVRWGGICAVSVRRGGVCAVGVRRGGISGVRQSWGGIGLGDSWGGIGHGGGYSLGDDLGVVTSLAANDGVEAVVGVSGVLDDTAAAVRLDQRVFALDDVALAGLVLGLIITGVLVVDLVGETVLGVGVVGLLDDSLGEDGGSRDGLGDRRRSVGVRQSGGGVGVSQSWGCVSLGAVSERSNGDTAGDGHESGEHDEL